MTFIKLYRVLGVRLIKDLLIPKVIKTDSFYFPRASSLFYLGDFDVNNFPKSGKSYLTNQTKTYLYTIDEYYKPEGKFRPSTVKINSIIRENKSIDDGHRYILNKAKMLIAPPTTMSVYNYGALHDLFKYTYSREMDYDIIINSLKTLLHDAGNETITDRVRYIPINIPSTFPKAKEFFINLNKSKVRISSIFDTPELKIIFELFKWINPETSKDSVFSEIKKENMDSTIFLFNYGNSMAMTSAKNLMGIVKGSGLDTRMTEYSGKKPGYILLHFLLSVVRSEPQTLEELDKKEIEYEKIADANEDVTIAVMLDNIENSVDNDLDEQAKEEKEIETFGETSVIENMDNDDLEIPDIEKLTTENKSSYDITSESLKTKLSTGNITEKEYERQISILTDQQLTGILKENEIKLEDLIIEEKETELKDSNIVSDKSMLKDTIGAIDKHYIEKIMKKDITNVIYSMQNSGHIVESYKVEKTESILGEIEEHQITVQPTHGRKTTLKIKIPGIDTDGVFKISGNSYILRKQRTDVPIKKTNATTAGLTSYYGKLFITKASFKKSDTGYAIRNSLIKLSGEENPSIKLLVLGNTSVFDEKLPLTYSMFGRYVKSFVHNNIKYNFDFKNRKMFLNTDDKLSDIEKDKYTLIGAGKSKYMVMDIDSNVYELVDKKYNLIGNLFDLVGIDYSNLPVEFSSIRIMNSQVPTVLLLMYYYGLNKLIKILKAKVRIIPSNKRDEIKKNEYVVKFRDKKYIFDRNDKLASMILGGLIELKNEIINMDVKSLNTKDGVINICMQRELKNRHITEIKILESMYVDPITKSVLETLKEPTTFTGLLIRSNELLLTDDAKHPNSLDGMVIKGYERISGMLYKELVTVVKDYENKNGVVQTRLTINPYSVWATINSDSTSSLVDDLNPIMALKQKEEITYTGSGGRSKDTLTKPTREFHESEVGIVSEATKDSSDVGVNAYLSAVPLLNNVRGITKQYDEKEINVANILSTSALLAPGAIHDDPKRVNKNIY